MLKLRIDSHGLSGGWRWTGRRWENVNSWVEPFEHPSLEPVAFTDGPGLAFLVRERLPGTTPPGPEPHPGPRPDWTSWSADFTAVALDPVGRRARITSGAFGTAPVFACERNGTLHASWDLTELPLAGTALNEREVARLLTMRLRYSAETVFADVYRVTERATIETAFAGQLQICYPAPALHSAPRSLVHDADVTGAYERILDAVLADHVYDPCRALVELSGGVDSANVALSLAARPGGHMVRPGAIVLDGQRAAQQVSRRRDLIRACGFTAPDITIRATARPPLHPDGQRARTGRVSPYDEPYHEAMSRLHHTAAGHGIRHVFTGIGGDEMVAVSRTEADAAAVGSDRDYMPWITARTRSAAEGADDAIAPASRINEMTLIAAGCAAPIILTTGSWPVHPLADPRLITFGEWLPEHWRRGKHLHRERLTRRGLGPRIARPPLPEVFTGIMDQGLREYGAGLGRRLACHGGHLIDSGYVDAARLAEACDRITSGAAQPRDREIFDVLALELAITALAGHPRPVC